MSDHTDAVTSLLEARLHTPAVVRATDFAVDVLRGKDRTVEDLQAAVDGLDAVLDAFHCAA